MSTVQAGKSNLKSKEAAMLENLVRVMTCVFALSSAEVGRIDLVQHQIDMRDNLPVAAVLKDFFCSQA